MIKTQEVFISYVINFVSKSENNIYLLRRNVNKLNSTFKEIKSYLKDIQIADNHFLKFLLSVLEIGMR